MKIEESNIFLGYGGMYFIVALIVELGFNYKTSAVGLGLGMVLWGIILKIISATKNSEVMNDES